MGFVMRPSRVLRRLRGGQVAHLFKVNTADARVCEIAAMHGFDGIWTCLEHVGNDLSVVERQVHAAKAHDTDLVCRVARGSYSELVRPLELDASGIIVPHVMGLEDARRVVAMTRFHPLGRRAVDGGNADAAYTGVEFTDYLRQANRERFVVLQIEDPEPLDELDAIAALDGFDVLFFGAADFSHAIGVPGRLDHPDVCEARVRIAHAARANGKFAGAVCSPEGRDALVDMGYTLLSLGADVVGLARYCRSIAEACGFGPTGIGGRA
jgi:4-hydroxy-2-oxoheptanedioate aldolase